VSGALTTSLFLLLSSVALWLHWSLKSVENSVANLAPIAEQLGSPWG
jgi:hypothetical protein